MRPSLVTRTALESLIIYVTADTEVDSATIGKDSSIISCTWRSLTSSMDLPSLMWSRIIFSDMLPTDTLLSMTGSWDTPAVLMSSEATLTVSLLLTDMTFLVATSYARAIFLCPLAMLSRVSNRAMTVL